MGKPRRTGRAVDGPDLPTGGATFRYIETSALVAALLDEDATTKQAVRGEGKRIASALTFVESARALIQARVAGRISPGDERALLRRLRRFEHRCEIVAISDTILARAARPFAVEPLRTLDAIHLATLDESGETPQLVTIVTRDRRIRENAIAMGYVVE